MSTYVFGSRLRYENYLQARSFEDSVRTAISTASRSIIATTEELERDHIAVLKSMSKGVARGFEQLSFDVRALSAGIAELNSTFYWGFSETLALLGGINDSLCDLIRIAKTPEKTWAYEQFNDARDAFRKGLYEDAIRYLNLAIKGNRYHTGYNLEYRFHYLLGVILVGSFKNYSCIDLPEAERAFFNAAKYARHDHPQEAARSCLCAGWSAYCQGHMETAEGHTRNALALATSFAEAHFQLAKILAHNSNPAAAVMSLRSAIRLDRGYAVKAFADGDLNLYRTEIDSLLLELRREAKEEAQSTVASIQDSIDILAERQAKFPRTYHAPVSNARGILATARATMAPDTYYSYLDALRVCDSAKTAVQSAEQTDLWVRRSFSEAARSKATAALWLSLAGLVCLPTVIPGLVFALIALHQFRRGADQEGSDKAYGAIAIAFCLIIVYGMYYFKTADTGGSQGSTASESASGNYPNVTADQLPPKADHPEASTSNLGDPPNTESRQPEPSSSSSTVTTQSDISLLTFAVQPTDAAIYIDKNFVGIAENMPQGVRVSPGDHLLAIERRGFQSHEETVFVEGAVNVEVALRRVESIGHRQ